MRTDARFLGATHEPGALVGMFHGFRLRSALSSHFTSSALTLPSRLTAAINNAAVL